MAAPVVSQYSNTSEAASLLAFSLSSVFDSDDSAALSRLANGGGEPCLSQPFFWPLKYAVHRPWLLFPFGPGPFACAIPTRLTSDNRLAIPAMMNFFTVPPSRPPPSGGRRKVRHRTETFLL